MSASRSFPWPDPTPAPAFAAQDPRSHKRRRLQPQVRQTIADQSQVEAAGSICQWNSGNEVYSCFPTSDTIIPQGEWASFVWNSRRPEITQTNLVNIYLFRADSQQQVVSFMNYPNPTDQAGVVRTQVDDRWFGEDGLSWSGQNISYPFYWVITRSDSTLNGNQIPQSIFTAVQTTVLDSVATSSSAAAASSASASALSVSAQSASQASGSSRSASSSPTGLGGSVQNASSGSSFPHWAIAVIVVLGFLALVATCLLAFLILRRLRRRQLAQQSRNSMGSNSPMINRDADMSQRYDSPGSPLLPPSAIPMVGAAGAGAAWHGHGSMHDNASTDSGPFSGADAAIMAQAFRTTLKQPNFLERPVEEGESPDQNEDDGVSPTEVIGSSTLNRELAAEGRDIRSVSSSRGVKVESPTGPGETDAGR